MSRTPYEQIIKTEFIGKTENPVSVEQLASFARNEKFTSPARGTLLLAIDIQQDFMDGGALGVSGAVGDVGRLTRFVYENLSEISAIAVTLDTHSLKQIFHACWWRGENGEAPAPYTMIAKRDFDAGKWKAFDAEKSAEYLENIEARGKNLIVWPYHCLEGTTGCALENQFSNIINFHSLVSGSPIKKIRKGFIPETEFYGAFRPEYSPNEIYTNFALIDELSKFERIVAAGEALDYCVFETVKQLLEGAEKLGRAPKLYLLEDCCSAIQPRETAMKQYDSLIEKYGMEFAKSEEIFL